PPRVPEDVVRFGLRARMLSASAVLTAIVAGVLASLLVAIGDLRGAQRDARRSDEIAAAANDLERLAIDLETGQRGFIITGQESFLAPWAKARRGIPGKERALASP